MEERNIEEVRIEEVNRVPTVPCTKLPREVVLQLENHQLKQMNIVCQLKLIQAELEKRVKERANITEEMEAYRVKIREEYGIDVAMTHISSDGTVRPLTPQEIQ